MGTNKGEVRWIRKEKRKEKGRTERKWEKTNRREKKKKGGFRFSLRSMEVRPSVFVGARGKVDPRNESYAWV